MIKTENKVLFLVVAASFVSILFPVAGKFFAAEISNVTVEVPGTQENQVPINSGSGGSGLLLNNNNNNIKVSPEQKATPPLVVGGQSPKKPAAKATENVQPVPVSLLPLAVADLSQKIPEFSNILSKLNINNTLDVANLKNYNIFLPGIKEISGADFINLNIEGKNKIPTETLFVSLGNGKIDALTKLDFSDSNTVAEKVNVFTGEAMRLIVKPKNQAKSVSGYVLFKAPADKIAFTGKYIPSFNVALASLAGSIVTPVIVPSTGIGKSAVPLKTASQFMVLSFSYNDNDKDGIYVADINAPVVKGEYEVVTTIDYGSNAKKDINFTTLVDPEGYIYEQTGDKELRINNATVSLYYFNSSNHYELWGANEYGQENPQVTDATGNYSFLVPAGTYYLTVKTPSYYLFQGDAFSVAEGKEIHANIALKKEFDFNSFLNWNVILIIILFCLVAYNFYRDWKYKK